jgi:hypothetical protein
MTDEPPKPPTDTSWLTTPEVQAGDKRRGRAAWLAEGHVQPDLPLHPPFGHMTIGQQVAYLIGMVLFIGSVLGVAALVAGLLWRLIAAVWGIG